MASNPEPIVYRVAIEGADQVKQGAATTSAALQQLKGEVSPAATALQNYSIANNNAGVASEGLNKNIFKLRA